MPHADRSATRRAAIAELTRQQAAYAPSEQRTRHLEALRGGAPAIVTGQQAGLFLGPGYTVYKAATAIVEARRRGAVPIFWLQAEDHDADEVKACAVLDADGELHRVELPPAGPARVALAHLRLPAGVPDALSSLAQAFDGAPFRDECLAFLARHFSPGAGWVEAFGAAIAELFAAEGLVVLHPRTPAMAELARPVHRFAIEQAERIDQLLAESSGVAQQVRLRPGCLLSFHHPEGAEGPRFRPVREGEGYRWPGGDGVPASELLDRLERAPLTFSTSALLRPLMQDHLLPTAAYVAGPGEARYLRQVQPLHAALGLSSPEILLRARFVVTDAPRRKKLAALGLTAVDLERPEDELLARFAASAPGPDGARVRAELLEPLLGALDALAPELMAIDAGLSRAIERTRQHVGRGLGRLAHRVDSARRRRDEVTTARLADLQRHLRPCDAPQERTLSFPHFAAWFGVDAFKQAVLGAARAGGELQELAL